MIFEIVVGILIAVCLIPLLPALICLAFIVGGVALLLAVGAALHGAGLLLPAVALFAALVAISAIVGMARRAIDSAARHRRRGEKHIGGRSQ